MNAIDFSPLFRSAIGFDRLARLMDNARNVSDATGYPPYNIEKTGDDAWRVSVAVAGFADTDLSVEVREKSLIVSGRKTADETPRTYLHRGIATRAFERRFHLADHVRVTGATHVDGMLHVDLVREVPEALKPRQIEIARGDARAIDVAAEAKSVN